MVNTLVANLHLWDTTFLHVTTLSFGNSSSWEAVDLTMLSLFPVLHDLALHSYCSWIKVSTVSPHLPIILKHLHILRVCEVIPPEPLTKLVTPALEELHLEASYRGHTSIGALQSWFNPLCQHLYALLPEAVSAKEPEWAADLSKLVKRCTRIRSLYISKWMEEECKIHMTGHDVVLHVQSGN